jgi:hypothetical protein
MKYYTGIGSRQTPQNVLDIASTLAAVFASYGYVLRSGGADGMDTAFEQGCDVFKGPKEIYLPWKMFNNNTSNIYTIMPEAFVMAREIHPNWEALSSGGQKLHARNMHQVLGRDLNTPSRFVVCYTEPEKGGTSQALRLADKYGIPIINIWEYDSSLWDINSHDGREEIITSILRNTLTVKYKLKGDIH